jgi:hypothetical protein
MTLSRLFLACLALCGVTTAFVPTAGRATAVARHSFGVPRHSGTRAVMLTPRRAAPKDDVETTAATTTLEKKEDTEEEKKEEDAEELNILQQIKAAGTAGSISLFLWEAAFWAISIPVALVGYYEATGHWPDISDQEEVGKLGAAAFAFANAARFALPLRLGLALGTTPWVQTNIVDTFFNKDDEDDETNDE